MRIDVLQGSKGRWRWHVRDDRGKLLAQSGPHGFETEAGARMAVERFLRHDDSAWWTYLVVAAASGFLGAVVMWIARGGLG